MDLYIGLEEEENKFEQKSTELLAKEHKFFEFLLKFFNVGAAIEIWGNDGEKIWADFAPKRKNDRHFLYFYINLTENNKKKMAKWYNNYIRNIDLQTFEIIKKENPQHQHKINEKYKIDNFAEFNENCAKFVKINDKIDEMSEVNKYKYKYMAANDVILFYSLLADEDKEKLI